MDQTQSRKNNSIKLIAYLALLLFSFYLIAHLNIFPGAVSYIEKSEGVVITQGSVEKSSVTLDVEEYETSDWLRLRLLQADIRALQEFLTLFSILIPFSLFFILEHKRFEFFKGSKTLKILSLVLFFFVLFLALTFGYVEALGRIDENLTAILMEN